RRTSSSARRPTNFWSTANRSCHAAARCSPSPMARGGTAFDSPNRASTSCRSTSLRPRRRKPVHSQPKTRLLSRLRKPHHAWPYPAEAFDVVAEIFTQLSTAGPAHAEMGGHTAHAETRRPFDRVGHTRRQLD